MLRFFRHIRRSLIDSGNARTYFLYSLDEIALVVVGILIALRVNNWDTYRNEVASLRSHLAAVLENLDDNRAQLEVLQNNRLAALDTCYGTIDRYRASRPIPLSDFMAAYGPIVIEQRFEMSSSGFERVKASELYESDALSPVRTLLREYENLVELNRYTESKLNGHIEAMEEELFRNGFYDGIWGYLRANVIGREDPGRAPPDDADMIGRMQQYGALVGIFLRYEIEGPIIVGEYERILDKGDELRSAVEDYLSR